METGSQILNLTMLPRREAWWAVFGRVSEDAPVWAAVADPVRDAVLDIGHSVRDMIAAEAVRARQPVRAGKRVSITARESSIRFTTVWAQHWADGEASAAVRRRVQNPVRDETHLVYSQVARGMGRRVRLVTSEEERHAY